MGYSFSIRLAYTGYEFHYQLRFNRVGYWVIVAITITGIYFRHRLEVLGLNICMVGALTLRQTLKFSFHRTHGSLRQAVIVFQAAML